MYEHTTRAISSLDDATGVARLRLTRADGRNAIDMDMVSAIHSAVEDIVGRMADTRALLIEADGPSFTVGGDLNHLTHHVDRLADELADMIAPFHESLSTIAELPVPVVCAVQGAAAGGGLGLLWCSDIVVAADDLTILTAFSRLGVSGDGGSSWYLPRLIGLRRAQEIVLESTVLHAEDALRYGLVTRVVPRDALEQEARATTERLAAGPTVGLGLQRGLLRKAQERTLAEGFAAELVAMRLSGATEDAAEGMGAFVEGRAPQFRAR